jgi:hypothetical protein
MIQLFMAEDCRLSLHYWQRTGFFQTKTVEKEGYSDYHVDLGKLLNFNVDYELL